MQTCGFPPSHSQSGNLALFCTDPALKVVLIPASFGLALPSSRIHRLLAMLRNVAEDQQSDRAMGPPQTQLCSQRGQTIVCVPNIVPRHGSYWLMVSSAAAASGALVEETASFLEALERRRWICSQS